MTNAIPSPDSRLTHHGPVAGQQRRLDPGGRDPAAARLVGPGGVEEFVVAVFLVVGADPERLVERQDVCSARGKACSSLRWYFPRAPGLRAP